jgi:hypothetical protein
VSEYFQGTNGAVNIKGKDVKNQPAEKIKGSARGDAQSEWSVPDKQQSRKD